MDQDYEHVQCPVCGPEGEQKPWLLDGKMTRYVHCSGCGTVYASPRASYAQRYSWLQSTFGMGENILSLTENRKPVLVEEASIIQNHSQVGRILDVGCSIGAFLGLFPSPPWERWGVEISPSAAAYAARNFSAKIHVGKLEEADFTHQFFDAITMIDILYYLDDPASYFARIRQLIKPTGVLGVEIAGQSYMLRRSHGPLSLILDHRWSRLASDSAYLFWFNPTGLEILLRRSGFQPIGWHIVASPKSSDRLRNQIAHLYFEGITRLVRRVPKMLTWAPKYLCLALPR